MTNSILNANKIFMVGIKGGGMAALAVLFTKMGKQIIGSDTKEVFFTDKILASNNIKVLTKVKANDLKDIDVVVHSTAYDVENNSVLKSITKLDLPIFSYPQALGQLIDDKTSIAVAGSHGKTTTTALLGYILKLGKFDPSVIVGSNVEQFSGNALFGNSNYLVVEADEYQNKLQYYSPEYLILNNIDWDHPDFFKDEKHYLKVFKDLIKKMPAASTIVANYDDPNVRLVLQGCQAEVIKYGLTGEADWHASLKSIDENYQYLDIFHKGKLWQSVTMSLFGEFNIQNALAAIAMAHQLGVTADAIIAGLKKFIGTERRFEIKGKYKGALIVDDFAHHPGEIKATLKMARMRYSNRRIITVFHPHTFSRTEKLFSDFSESFWDTNLVLVLDIYTSARERYGSVSAKDLVTAINEKKGQAIYIKNHKKALEYLQKNILFDDLIITMGAGDVWRVGEDLLNSK